MHDRNTKEASIDKRDFHYVGNQEKRAYLQGGIEIYENNVERLSPDAREKTLTGMQTLSEVQHKLDVVKKNKQAIEARLHFYEQKLETELPRLSHQ